MVVVFCRRHLVKTSSTKPEVHNVLQRRQRRTEPRTATSKMHKNWWVWPCTVVSNDVSGRTDILITILCTSPGGEVKARAATLIIKKRQLMTSVTSLSVTIDWNLADNKCQRSLTLADLEPTTYQSGQGNG